MNFTVLRLYGAMTMLLVLTNLAEAQQTPATSVNALISLNEAIAYVPPGGIGGWFAYRNNDTSVFSVSRVMTPCAGNQHRTLIPADTSLTGWVVWIRYAGNTRNAAIYHCGNVPSNFRNDTVSVALDTAGTLSTGQAYLVSSTNAVSIVNNWSSCGSLAIHPDAASNTDTDDASPQAYPNPTTPHQGVMIKGLVPNSAARVEINPIATGSQLWRSASQTVQANDQGQAQLNLNGIPTGTHAVTVSTRDKVWSTKIVVN